MTETQYLAAVTAKGYGDPVQKVWEAGIVNDAHTHDVGLFLFIQDGEMAVAVDPEGKEQTTICRPGDTIEVPAGVVHAERVGDRGVTFLVARK